jgi:hypothetical protein
MWIASACSQTVIAVGGAGGQGQVQGQGGIGQAGAGAQGGKGGGPGCGTPTPVPPISSDGATAATTTGVFACASNVRDSIGQRWGVECNGNSCNCTFADKIVCTCVASGAGSPCGEGICCPGWPKATQ